MLRPEQLSSGPMRVKCNCCERATEARIERLENMDGTLFDVREWKKKIAIAEANKKAEMDENLRELP